MALDTRDELASVLGRGVSFLTVFPAPSGTLAEGDLRQLLGLYRGFSGDIPIVEIDPVPERTFYVKAQDRTFVVRAQNRTFKVKR